ncbi:MAG: hypothetical protein WCP21_07485, partial [Armatimonadota bacterium]
MVSSRPVSLCVLVFTLVVAGGMASARTINVSAGQSIQNAINTAIKGDIIVVAKGRYRECIDFKGKAITVQSTKPADKTVVAATIIDGDKKGSVVTFKSGETSQTALRGLTITNGRGTGFPFYLDDYEYYGGGVYCESSSPTLNLNIIISNSAMSISHDAMHPRYGNGGGVYCKGGSPTLTSNTINNNSTNGSGGGVHCTGSSPTLTGNAILGNSATNGSGGGVYCSGGSPILSDNTIRGNGTDGAYPGGSGGGVCCVGGKPSLIKNTI